MPTQNPPLAYRVAEIPPFHVMEVVAEAAALEAKGMDVIHLEVGEPDFSTPAAVMAAAHDAMASGYTRYTDARGLPALREAIASWYASQGLVVPAARIQVTQGASGALLLAAAATVNPGDQVLMADPAYPCNPRFVEAVGGGVHWLHTKPADAFQPKARAVRTLAGAEDRVLMLAHPANPTGMAVPSAELSAMVMWCRETRRHLIVDEIYQPLGLSGEVQSSLHLGQDHFVVGSFSKYFNMTGWRLGWLVMPEYAVAACQKLAQHLFICAPTIAQHAAMACFDPGVLAEAEARRAILKSRRDFLVPRLRALGFDVPLMPDGAFYVFADASAMTQDSQAFCVDLIRKTGVAITPGTDFSQALPPTWIRIAFTETESRLHEALRRIENYLAC